MQKQSAAWAACTLLLWAGCGSQTVPTDTSTSPTTTVPTAAASGSAGAPVTAAAAGASGRSTTVATPAVAGQTGAVTPATGAAGSAPKVDSGSGGASAMAAGTSAAVAGASGSTAAAGSSSAAGTSAAAGGGAAGSGAAGDGAVSPTSMFKRGCKNRELGPCASFIPENGKEIELGPYGALMEVNVGKGFEYAVASGDSDDNASCKSFTASFGEDPKSSEMLLDVKQLDFSLYTVYRPAQFKEGEKAPIITWGNGTCAQPEGYGALLRYVASHGFFVVAANSRWVGNGSPMKKGLDFAFAANDDKNSPYYQKLDTTKVGAMGHSQGGQGTVAIVGDARVKAVIIWNMTSSTSKPFLAVSGDTDVVRLTPESMRRAVNNASVQAAFLYYHMVPETGSASGHLTLMTQPERVIEPAVAWWKFILGADSESKLYFSGANCKLCNRKDEFEFGQKGLD